MKITSKKDLLHIYGLITGFITSVIICGVLYYKGETDFDMYLLGVCSIPISYYLYPFIYKILR